MLIDYLMSGKYVGNRPIKLRKSNWRERIDTDAVERQKVKQFYSWFALRLKFSFLLNCSMCGSNLCGVFLTEPKSKETKAFEEECIAQVNSNGTQCHTGGRINGKQLSLERLPVNCTEGFMVRLGGGCFQEELLTVILYIFNNIA